MKELSILTDNSYEIKSSSGRFELGNGPCRVCVQEDVFTVNSVDLGPLKKLRIRHDNSHSHSSWYLDRVEIVDTKDDTT